MELGLLGRNRSKKKMEKVETVEMVGVTRQNQMALAK